MKREKKYLLRYGTVVTAAILLVLFADYLGLFNGVNTYMYDLCFRIRGERITSKNIVIAAIDEKSLARLGRWPLRRLHYAVLLDRLNQTRLVGMDVIMAEPSEDDLVLADAIKKHGRVILPVYIDQRLSLVGPLREFSPFKTGHAHIEPDIDGIVRRIFHSLYFKDALLPSFASVIYEETSGNVFTRQKVTPGSGLITQADLFRINYYGTRSAFQEISVSDIIDGKYPPPFFAGKIVLVGVTAVGIEEKLFTPFTQERSKFSGVELHAHILNNLFDRNNIREIPAWIRWIVSLIYSLSFLLTFLRLNERASGLLCLLAIAFGVMSVFVLFSFLDIWLSPAVMLSLVVFMFLVSYLVKIDIAAARLDDAYLSVISHLRLSDNGMTNQASPRGFWGILSKGVINSRLEIMTQITDQLNLRRQEAEFEKLQAMEANRAKSDFLANMSHELRTPLTSIIGFSEILEDGLYGSLNEKQKEYIQVILDSSSHLLSLINDMIDLSKVELGKAELELSRFPVRDILETSITMLKEKAMKHFMQLESVIDPGADVEIEADERKLKQILFNLLSNAVKFTPDGGSVQITARRIKGLEGWKSLSETSELPHFGSDRDFIEISVADTGIGIKLADMPKLFKEFSQVESVYTKQYEGTGLGLALTKKLIELHGGKIWVESEFGKGSKFIFAIPVKSHTLITE